MFAIFGATTQKTKVTIPHIFSNLFIIAQGTTKEPFWPFVGGDLLTIAMTPL